MIQIVPVSKDHYADLFKLSNEAELFAGTNFNTFVQNMGDRFGFGYWECGELIGSIILSDYIPRQSIMVHALFHPRHKGKMSRRIIKHLFDFVFNKLEVRRVTSYSVIGVTDSAGEILRKLGFEPEGRMREAAMLPTGIYDVIPWAMLKRECRWA